MQQPTKKARVSLFKVFSAGLAGIFVVFVLLSYFTFSRLLNFETVLVKFSNHALPNLISTSHLFNQSARLLESTELLSQSTSYASKRLVEKQLNANLDAINLAVKAIDANEFLDIQLDTIHLELDEFSVLVGNLLALKEKMRTLKGKISLLGIQASNVQQFSSSDWLIDYLQALLNTKQALDEARLQQVRLLFKQLEAQLDHLDRVKSQNELKPMQQHMIQELRTLVFGKDGLADLKIQILQLQGRVTGRGNFVHHLIEDYVAHLGYISNETEQNITQQVADSVSDLEQETQLMRYVLAGGVIFLLSIIILFQRRVLKRLRIVNQMVRNQALGDECDVVIHGNDEITDLAHTFREFTHTIEQQKQALEELSMLDGLTGIANRRALDIRLEHDIELAKRQKMPIAVLLMDIDNFKLYNDNYGHMAGDNCLKSVADILSNILQRESDFVARYGGEEFICILPHAELASAEKFAQKIVDALQTERLPHSFSDVTAYITLSIGIAFSRPDNNTTPEMLLQQADEALYAAKAAGKNTYKVYV
ncbi:diguanylate cyclase [Paraglaciecola aestuariivivens]